MNTEPAAATRLLESLRQQAEIYEQLLVCCNDDSMSPNELAQFAEESQQRAHRMSDEASESWGEISADLDPQVRRVVSVARSRVHDAIDQIIECHESIIGKFEPTAGDHSTRESSDAPVEEPVEAS